MDDDIADIRQSILQGQAQLEYLKDDSDSLTQEAQQMKDQITALQETNVEGALNLTKEARRRSQQAADKVHSIQAMDGDLKQSENKRLQTNNLMTCGTAFNNLFQLVTKSGPFLLFKMSIFHQKSTIR